MTSYQTESQSCSIILIMILSNDSTYYLQKCNGSFLEEFSDFCLTPNNSFEQQCFPSENEALRFAAGVWSIIFGIVGLVGNLLTIIAIPYAAKNNQ